MCSLYRRSSILCLALAQLILNQAGAAPVVTVGIVLPQGQGLEGAANAESMRQSLIGQLQAHAIDAVPLSATTDNLLDTEAQANHCQYLLYTHLQTHHFGGLRGKLSALRSLPLLAFGAKGAKYSMASTAMQGAANAAGPSAKANVKQGDTMELAYRLRAVGSTNPASAQSFSSDQASSDGQDIVTALVAQVAAAASATAQGNPPTTSQAMSTPASGDAPAPTGRSSIFGGLLGHRSISSSKAASGAASTTMDCAQLASTPNAPMSLDTCESLKHTQQNYEQAAADPAASRAGDDQLTCAQIAAELKQQQYTTPDRTKVAEASATVQEQQGIQRREYANALKQQAQNQAAVNAASATDTATELASGGLVRGRALEAAEKGIDARNRANNERVIKEDLPVTQKMLSQSADLGAGFGQQLQSNHRLARLVQLANSKGCKGGGQ